ncbi:hypothetical protein NFI96_022751 [Prochilodus magdalenae]|nr:hypothetical protein NFI96_022751 [Prochilodus magdalenae]
MTVFADNEASHQETELKEFTYLKERKTCQKEGSEHHLGREEEHAGKEDELNEIVKRLKRGEDQLKREKEQLKLENEKQARKEGELNDSVERLKREDQLNREKEELKLENENQRRREDELIEREKSLNRGEDKLKEEKEQLRLENEKQRRREDELIEREKSLNRGEDKLKEEKEQLRLENEKQRRREHELNEREKSLNKGEDKLKEEKEQLRLENEKQRRREDELIEREKSLNRGEDKLKEEKEQLRLENEKQRRREDELIEREKSLNRGEDKLKEEKEQLRLENEKQRRREDELIEREKSLNRGEDKMKEEKEQLRLENETQIRREHELNEREKSLNRGEDKMKEEKEQLRLENEKQTRRKDQLKEWNENLCRLENDLTVRSQRREIQLETIKRQEDEISLQKKIIEHLTKMKEEKEEEMKKDNERMKDHILQIERNCETLKTQEEKLQMFNTDVQTMKKQREREKESIHREKQWIEKEREALKTQWTEIEEEKEKIQTQERVNTEEIDRQEMEKLKNEMEIKTQTALIQTQKEEMKKCEEALEKQEKMKERNKREIEQQTTQLQEQRSEIQTQKEEIDRQERKIQTNRGILKKTRRNKLILDKKMGTEEKELQRWNEKFQKQLAELERLKELHKENVRIKRLEDEQNKYREIRRREEDLQTLQDVYYQLDTRLSSSNYMPDCNTEGDLLAELGKIIEKIKMEVQNRSEEVDVVINTQDKRKRRQRQESGKKDNLCNNTILSHKVFEERQLQRTFTENKQDPDSQDVQKSNLKSVVDILQCLGLDNFYTNKLTIEHVLSIGSPNEKSLKGNMGLNYLKKLLMQDYRVRFITDGNENKDFTLSDRTVETCDRKDDLDVHGLSDATNNDSNDYNARCETNVKGIPQSVSEVKEIYEYVYLDEFLSERDDSNNAKEKEAIHPMDVQMAVFHCADSFLRQNMVTKLSSCQYALPLLVPSPTSTDIELPLWTFRQIKKTWKSVGGSSTSLPVCQVKAPMVFFCRLGSVSTSKSQLLNSLINPKHDTFFHRDSPGSSRTRLFMEGLVEIAWYCPAGNTDDLFSDITAFCNLHGDAVKHRDQTDVLSEGAAISVVLMQNMKPDEKGRELLQKLHKSSSPLICLVCDLQKGPLNISQGLNVKIGLRDRNRNDLDNELRTAIKICLQKRNINCTFNLQTLSCSVLVKRFGFRVDETSRHCQEGKIRAEEVIKLLEGEDISQIKNKFLPCQGKLWQEWSSKNKQLHRLHGDTEQNRTTLAEMKKIRMKQHGKKLQFIECFVNNLLSNSTTQSQYFIQWIRHFIDDKFSDQVSQVNLKYNSKWLAVQELKNTPGKSDELKVLQKQLEDVSKELDTVTFGLKHIFREMGQIYEARDTVPEEMGAKVAAFATVAADLLISGHPLELMDGDAAHVPLTWIESVLDKVSGTLGDQRVFVLSVLGLQSSGKSTMLNTMFGLQFAVRAGRCTRGAFMQLIRVKEEVKEELRFDYLLVVDTEGLQSLQLVSNQSALIRNNELATFVTGLADLTLINIFGENPAEMKDIIQIVVQAFLRMKEVKLTPSCMFVHQNVPDISAGEKNMEGRRRLQDKLDQMIREVCHMQDSTSVIKFLPDVHYFAQLWEGNPPTGPPNPRYSENAENLKQAVLTAAAEENCQRLSELKVRIKDLWTAVLSEDFVFSFSTIQTNSDEYSVN